MTSWNPSGPNALIFDNDQHCRRRSATQLAVLHHRHKVALAVSSTMSPNCVSTKRYRISVCGPAVHSLYGHLDSSVQHTRTPPPTLPNQHHSTTHKDVGLRDWEMSQRNLGNCSFNATNIKILAVARPSRTSVMHHKSWKCSWKFLRSSFHTLILH